uniref:Transmembrane protein n=2 Tax=Schistosoma mansoni TaxID=6183 RepID=G4VE31_SCHMA
MMNLYCMKTQNNLLPLNEPDELSKTAEIPLNEQKVIPTHHLHPLTSPLNRNPCHVIYDGVQSDCCIWSPDPLINGPARCGCFMATILAIFSIILLLIGIILTILHYVIGMEFYTVNRGQTVGPLLLGLTIIPLIFMIYFICIAKHKIADYFEQLALNYRAKERTAYRQYQAELARSSIGLQNSSR